MSSKDVRVDRAQSPDVVRLKVDGADLAVNTLRDQQTARGLSLICPFPALEVEIPVAFGEGGTDPARRGTIHRIGVEDDPSTGLPRLRLSLRAHESRATVVSAPSQSLLDEVSRMTEAPDARAKTDLDVLSDVGIELEDDLSDILKDTEQDSPIDLFEQRSARPTPPPLPVLDFIPETDEPAWVGCGELPLPDQITDRARTRRRGRIASAAAWLVVLGLAVGGVYVLDRAGVLSLDSLRERIAGFSIDSDAAAPIAEIEEEQAPAVADVVDLEEEAAPVATEEPAVSSYSGSDPVAEPALPEEGEEMLADAEAIAEPAPAMVETVSLLAQEVALEEVPAEAPAQVDEVEAEVVVSDDEVSFVLPTRWPAEYANAYRLRDPNGVVVDIPGGLIKREGWLEIGKDHPMIRSVKAVQRETGARYVVFVNGSLPRFMTAPKTGGIMLRLYRDSVEEPGETEQVAMLEK